MKVIPESRDVKMAGRANLWSPTSGQLAALSRLYSVEAALQLWVIYKTPENWTVLQITNFLWSCRIWDQEERKPQPSDRVSPSPRLDCWGCCQKRFGSVNQWTMNSGTFTLPLVSLNFWNSIVSFRLFSCNLSYHHARCMESFLHFR